MELLLFCCSAFFSNFKNISKRRNYQIVGVSGIANCSMQWNTVKIAVAE
jgi:hypothetical protein